MLVIDASAYPHIVQAILTEPVAWRVARSLNRDWREAIDAAMSVVTVDGIDDECESSECESSECESSEGESSECKIPEWEIPECEHPDFSALKSRGFGPNTTPIYLTTTPTPRLPRLTVVIDHDLAMQIGHLPPINYLCVKPARYGWPDEHPAFFFGLLGKVHTTRLYYSSEEWIPPCTTLIIENDAPSKVPASLRKIVVINTVFSQFIPFSTFEHLPRSVSEITLSFPNWRHRPISDDVIDIQFCRPLAPALMSGRTINLVQMGDIIDKDEQAWFAAQVRSEVERKLHDSGLFTTNDLGEVMNRFKTFDINTYREVHPDEI